MAAQRNSTGYRQIADLRGRLARLPTFRNNPMDQRIRLIAAAAVMFVGVGIALCFRRVPGETTMTIPSQNGGQAAAKPIAARNVTAEARPVTVYPAPRPLPVAAHQPRRESPTVVSRGLQPVPPPEFPKSYPDGEVLACGSPASSRWGASLAAAVPPPVTHKIVDGDTLPALAERYLGSESRAREIYEANRAVLSDPNILRIGVVLSIPSGDKAGSTEQ
jgi:nucleoid-associated protein YgaU